MKELNLFEDEPSNYTNPTAALILQRRWQMLVHSYIYYELNTNIISDHQWGEWAKELARLQKDNPEIAKQVDSAEAFEGWDGSTGFALPKDPHIINKAMQLLRWEGESNADNS